MESTPTTPSLDDDGLLQALACSLGAGTESQRDKTQELDGVCVNDVGPNGPQIDAAPDTVFITFDPFSVTSRQLPYTMLEAV